MPSLKVISSQVMTNVDILKEKFRATRPISKDSTPNSLDSIMILKNQKKKGRNFMHTLLPKKTTAENWKLILVTARTLSRARNSLLTDKMMQLHNSIMT